MLSTSLFKKSDSSLSSNVEVKNIPEIIKNDDLFLWVDIEKPNDAEIEMLLNVFGLHPLTVEDCIMPQARPKAEQFENYLFLLTYAIVNNSKGKKVCITQLGISLTKNFLITVHSEPVRALDTLRQRLEKKIQIISKGADFLLYNILDIIVDDYFPITDVLDKRIDEIQSSLFEQPRQEAVSQFVELKNELLTLRRALGPQRDMTNFLLRGDFPIIKKANYVYFRDIFDHMIRINDLLDICRETITGSLEVYVSLMSNKMNEIMKTLTIIATIMMPLTLITGIYGMNFKYMPELEARFGYFGILALMAALTVLMLFFFKRRKWL